MSSIRTIAGQKLKELFGGHTTHIAEFESLQTEVKQAEASMKNMTSVAQRYTKYITTQTAYYSDFKNEIKILYPKTSAFRGVALQIVESLECMEETMKKGVEDLKSIDKATKDWFVGFSQIKRIWKDHCDVRQKYDHYHNKLQPMMKRYNELLARGAVDPKFEAKVERNIKKYENAKQLFMNKTQDTMKQMDNIMYGRYDLVNPVVMKILRMHYLIGEASVKAFNSFAKIEEEFKNAERLSREEKAKKIAEIGSIKISSIDTSSMKNSRADMTNSQQIKSAELPKIEVSALEPNSQSPKVQVQSQPQIQQQQPQQAQQQQPPQQQPPQQPQQPQQPQPNPQQRPQPQQPGQNPGHPWSPPQSMQPGQPIQVQVASRPTSNVAQGPPSIPPPNQQRSQPLPANFQQRNPPQQQQPQPQQNPKFNQPSNPQNNSFSTQDFGFPAAVTESQTFNFGTASGEAWSNWGNNFSGIETHYRR
eukprot:TRINITY_DN10646_c0_g1_i4.p2 TRINITY_DN10646_c0_g1~~TRINITY_DN10646_c0_g1_i4.p2  ORF type:complete len:476 (+),score=116.66 TRINITY_DN10646_c0_g1_i4:55-1482(+)